MKIRKNHFLAGAILSVILALAIIGLLPVKGQAITGTSASYCFLAVNPNPIGVGQTAQVSIIMWIPPPTATATGGDRWQGITVTITKPDNSVDEKGPFKTDAVGGAFFTYVPQTTGTYKFQVHFPGQHIVGLAQIIFGPPAQMDVQYQAADSNVVSLTVQSEPVTQIQVPPLPSTYWTRPINAQNEAWDSVSNNWLMPAWDSTNRQFDQGSCYVPVATAPTTAHVIWTKPLTFGGLIGGEFGTTAWHNGMSYEQFFKPPVVISGRLYYNTIQAEEPTNAGGGAAGGVAYVDVSTVTCVELATGKELFQIPNAELDFGQIYNFISPNQGGGHAFLWDTHLGTTWKMYDAWTGNYILSIANVSSGTTLLDNTFNVNSGLGDILVYSLDATGKLSLWNSSQIFATLSAPLQGPTNNILTFRIYNWQGQTVDGNLGKMWTKSLDNFPAGGSIAQVGYDNTVYVVAGQAIGVLGSTAAFSFPQKSTWAGYSMTDGSKLWGPNVIDATSKIPANGTTFPGTFLQARIVGMGPDKGILALFVKDTLQWYAWDVTTGTFLWGPTAAYTNSWGLYNYESQLIANGVLYNAGYDGIIHAFDVHNNGAELFQFSSGDAGTITPYGTWPFYNGLTVTKNAVIGTTGEHGNGVQPLYLGEGIYVVDPRSGQQLWNLTGWFCQPVIADGILVSHNLYDNQIYAFGKGPSAITVTAPNVNVPTGSAIVIQGSVTDESAGAKQLVADGKYSSVAAVSDADQGAWMNWLYEQVPPSSMVNGVQVTIAATDTSGNTKTLGTATSDSTGHYAFAWTPDTQGLFTIGATFPGSNSYWGSTAETSVAVGAATNPSVSPIPTGSVPTSTAPSPGVTTPLEWYLIAVAAIIIIVVIVASAVILRRRK